VWSYKGWTGDFYPAKSRPQDFLSLYSDRFTAVEGNTTFYAVPNAATIARWQAKTPPQFKFCPKFPKTVTHGGLLAPQIAEALAFIERMKIFNSQVGVALQHAKQFKEMKQQAANQPQNVVSQTLAMLNQVMDGQGFDDILDTTLRSITAKMGQSLRADRTTIFLLDREKNEFWSMIAEAEGDRSLEIRIAADKGIVGEVARTQKLINIPYDFYDDPRSATAKEQDKKNNYRTYTMKPTRKSNVPESLLC